jgi:hypothetical protein
MKIYPFVLFTIVFFFQAITALGASGGNYKYSLAAALYTGCAFFFGRASKGGAL